jgi:hypothetical protein
MYIFTFIYTYIHTYTYIVANTPLTHSQTAAKRWFEEAVAPDLPPEAVPLGPHGGLLAGRAGLLDAGRGRALLWMGAHDFPLRIRVQVGNTYIHIHTYIYMSGYLSTY